MSLIETPVASPEAFAGSILQMQGIAKRFGPVVALSHVDLDVRRGEVLALMGENGAGKSTLMKVLSGVYRADSGSIRIDGQLMHFRGPKDAIEAGISIIHQEIKLSPNLTVAENLYLGNEPQKRFWRVDRHAMVEGASAVLSRLGCTFSPRALVGSLSIAEQQQVEIARALHRNCQILVMDEPTAALSSRETENLFKVIKQLRDQGMAVVYISHRMAEVYELADRVSVLRDGAYVGSLEKDQIDAGRVVGMMVGRPLDSLYQKEVLSEFGPEVLRLQQLGDGGKIRDCSFHVRAGEVLGIAGLVGSGRSELAHMIFGSHPVAAGSITLDGQPYQPRNPLKAITAGIGYVPEDRKEQGLFLDMSARDNIVMNVIPDESRMGWLDQRRCNQRTDGQIQQLNIRLPHRRIGAGSLSGGNQQKLLVARWIEIHPKVLLLDEPTRGVDIGAKSEIYRSISQLAKNGVAVVLISSELPEVIAMSDRIMVMRDGHMAGELPGGSTQEAIMSLATH